MAGGMIAFFAAVFALSELRMIRRDSRKRTRPYVQLDVVPGLHGPGSWDLIIENRVPPQPLEVVIDAGKFIPVDAEPHIAPRLADYLLAPKTLVPGARRRVMWGFHLTDRNLKAGVLEPRQATVTYLDERKARLGWPTPRACQDTFTLRDAFGAAVFPAPAEGSKPTSQDMLAHIDRALRAMNGHIGELRR